MCELAEPFTGPSADDLAGTRSVCCADASRDAFGNALTKGPLGDSWHVPMGELTAPFAGQSADAVAVELPRLKRFPRLRRARLSPLFSKIAWKMPIARAWFSC